MGRASLFWSRRIEIGLAALVLLAACLALPSAAAAAEPTLQVTLVGWDGTVVPGAWSPVRVRVTGGSADLNARLEVVLKSRYQTGPRGASFVEFPTGAYGEEIALPAGVTKEVTLWVPADSNTMGSGMAGNVRVLAGGQTLAEQKVEFKASKTPYWPLVGVLAESPALARALAQVELPVQGLPMPLNPARLAAADIPPSAERLRALAALVVQGNAAATLTGEQRRAVEEWVSAGGHLLLAGGPDAVRAAGVLPPNSLPVDFSGADGSADLGGLAGWAQVRDPVPGPGPVARLKATSGSHLAGSADRPLVWRLGRGKGTITLLAADPSLAPLATWTGTPALLLKALEPALPAPTDNEKMLYLRTQEQDLPTRLAGSLEALPPEAYPDPRTVALILLGFTLLVGPLAHLLLWRIDRRGWVWLAVPAAALLLSASLYYLGIGRGGRDVLVNVVAHLRLDPDGGPARQSVAAGFYAPTHPELAVTVSGDSPVRAAGRPGGPMYNPVPAQTGSTPTEPPFRVISGRDTRVEFDSGQWTMRSVMLSRPLGPEVGRITARLGLEGGLIKGSVQNETPYPLEDAAVVVGQSLVKLGSLSPGQSVPVALDPASPGTSFGGGYFPLSWRLFGRRPASASGSGVAVAVPVPPMPARISSVASRYTAVMPGGQPEPLELPQDPEVQRRVRLLDPLINAPQMGPGAPAMSLTFLAFTRSPVGRDLPSAGDHPAYFLTLVEAPLRLEFPSGPFTLPPTLIPVEMLGQTGGWGSGGNGVISWIQVNNGSLTLGYRVPLPARARAEALLITTQQVGPTSSTSPGRGGMPPGGPVGPDVVPGPAEAGVFSVYNWQSAAWEPLPAGQEQVRLEPAAPYLGPEGLVKLMAGSGTDRMVNFLQPELTVEGRVME